jgi:hypothetical protein
MSTEHQPLKIDVNDPRLVFNRDIPEKAESANPDVVDPDIDAAEFLKRGFSDVLDLRGIADVALADGRFASCLPDFLLDPN